MRRVIYRRQPRQKAIKHKQKAACSIRVNGNEVLWILDQGLSAQRLLTCRYVRVRQAFANLPVGPTFCPTTASWCTRDRSNT